MMPGENENILIRVVDDDAHMRGSLEFMLTAEGFAVKTYPSAQAFCALAPRVPHPGRQNGRDDRA